RRSAAGLPRGPRPGPCRRRSARAPSPPGGTRSRRRRRPPGRGRRGGGSAARRGRSGRPSSVLRPGPGGLEHPLEGPGETLHRPRLLAKLPLPRGREPVELRLPVVLRQPPGALDEAPLLETVQRRVERPFLDPERVLGDLVEPPRDVEAVTGTERE